jgi:transcriptional regulator with XRE-family HTH domain
MADRSVDRSLAQKLDRLFTSTRPAGRGELTFEEVANSIRASGGPSISATYLWQLRKGIRDNPTKKHIEALATFFGVAPAYFFDDDVAERVDAQLDLLVAMRDASVRQVALRAHGLSPESLGPIADVIDQVRRLEERQTLRRRVDPTTQRPSGTGAS